MEPDCYLLMDQQINLKYGLMKELRWVLLLDSLNDILMATLMVQLIGSHWFEKT